MSSRAAIGFPWRQMSQGEFAVFETALGEKVTRVNGLCWRQVRPFFFRPVLPYREYAPGLAVPPRRARVGGFQHAVPAAHHARTNSSLRLLMFEELSSYSLAALNSKRRKEIRLASGRFTLRRVEDARELKEAGYPVYLSFYERTHYRYKAERRHYGCFCRWADALLRFPGAAVLGAYRDGAMVGLSVSMLVEDVLNYAEMFCTRQAMLQGVNSLMLHTVREAVAGSRAVKQIFAGPYKYEAGKHIDNFLASRGCKLVSKPALLRANPLPLLLVKCLMPMQYARFGREDAGPTWQHQGPSAHRREVLGTPAAGTGEEAFQN